MKKLSCLLLILLSFSVYRGSAQNNDSLGLPGDNLNLSAVLDLFKQSQNVEDFEKKLNDPQTRINNLDLNNDGKIDYIRVVDYGKDNFHSLVLQVPVSQTESQDVAVIEIEKKDNNIAHIQIVGDEDLYGKNYIIEPHEDQQASTPAPSNSNYSNYPDQQQYVYVNVWAWPSIGYMYGPYYTYWSSPWYWGYYPSWWNPWRPYGYYAYRQWYYYHPIPYCHRTYINHIVPAQVVYAPHKTSSVIVQKNVSIIKTNNYNNMNMNNIGGNKNETIQQNKNNMNGMNKDEPIKDQPQEKYMQQKDQNQNVYKEPANKPAKNNVENAPKPVKQERAPKQQEQPHMQKMPAERPARMNNGGGGGGRMGGGGRRK